MKVTKEEIYGYTGSGIFCLLIFLFLYLNVIKTTIQSGEEGILVNFGTVDLSSGTFEPGSGEPQSEINGQQTVPMPETPPVVQPEVQKKTATPAITQNREKTAAIATAQKEEQEEKKRIVAEQRKRAAINQQVSGAFGSAATGQNQRGTGTTGNGVQGSPQSRSSTGSPAGTGYGEFNLNGRTLGAGGLPRPTYTVQEEGRIVINITVDTKGTVIFAEIGRGTNIDNVYLRNSAMEAARKAKFNSISGNNNQSGTITYRYSLK